MQEKVADPVPNRSGKRSGLSRDAVTGGWQLLGITDLVLAVSLGTTARLLEPQGASMLAMTVLPLSLVPTFLIFHVICIAQARTWTAADESRQQTMRTVQHPAI